MKKQGNQSPKQVPADCVGQQLAVFLTRFQGISSRNQAKKVLSAGKVQLNGEYVGASSAGYRLAEGDGVSIHWDRPGSGAKRVRAQQELESTGLEILFEDAQVVAVYKPAGVLTDAATSKQARERATVTKWMRAYLKPKGLKPFVVHRIDRDTSGIVLFAKDATSAETLRTGFRLKALERLYWVAVERGPDEDEGTWEDWVRWDSKRRTLLKALGSEKDKKEARAHFTVLHRGPGFSFLQVELDTGKRNQIRYQCQVREFPLCGERQYRPRDFESRILQPPRQALHAIGLAFPHPRTGKRIALYAPLPGELLQWLKRLPGVDGEAHQSELNRRYGRPD